MYRQRKTTFWGSNYSSVEKFKFKGLSLISSQMHRADGETVNLSKWAHVAKCVHGDCFIPLCAYYTVHTYHVCHVIHFYIKTLFFPLTSNKSSWLLNSYSCNPELTVVVLAAYIKLESHNDECAVNTTFTVVHEGWKQSLSLIIYTWLKIDSFILETLVMPSLFLTILFVQPTIYSFSFELLNAFIYLAPVHRKTTLNALEEQQIFNDVMIK